MRQIFIILLMTISQMPLAFASCEDSSLTEAADKYLDSEVQQDWQYLYKVRSPEFKEQIPFTEFETEVSYNVNEIWLARFKLADIEVEEGSCLLSAELVYGILPSKKARFRKLVKTDHGLVQNIEMFWENIDGAWIYYGSTRAYEPFSEDI